MLTPAVLFALFLVFLGLTWTLSLAESAFSYLCLLYTSPSPRDS